MKQGWSLTLAELFTDADNNWDNVNADLDEYATDCHYATEMTYDFLFTISNTSSHCK